MTTHVSEVLATSARSRATRLALALVCIASLGGCDSSASSTEPSTSRAAQALAATDQELRGAVFDARDRFGAGVAVSRTHAVVGAPGDDETGAVYVYRWGVSELWEDRTRVAPATLHDGDGFGESVAIDGDVMVVGAPSDAAHGQHAGAAYVMRRTASGWEQEARLVASDPAAWALFGASVAVKGDLIVVGAKWATGSAPGAGVAYVFRRTGSAWNQEARLTAADGHDWAYLGTSVAIGNDEIFVGAPHDNGGASSAGAVYSFRRIAGAWQPFQKLTAYIPHAYEFFGSSLASDGRVVVVGATGGNDGRGAAYISSYIGGEWRQRAGLVPSDATSSFGSSVAVAGPVVAIGAVHHSVVAQSAGAVYVYRETSTPFMWAEVDYRTPRVSEVDDRMGFSVAVGCQAVIGGAPAPAGDERPGKALSVTLDDPCSATEASVPSPPLSANSRYGASLAADGALMAAGAPGATVAGAPYAGAAFVYERSGGNWSSPHGLVPPASAGSDEFGAAVAVSGQRVAVGARGFDPAGTLNGGAVFVYERTGSTWSAPQQLVVPSARVNDFAGSALALAGDWLFVGIPHRDTANGAFFESGAVAVYRRDGAAWTFDRELIGSPPIRYGNLGSSVDSDGEVMVAGAPNADGTGAVMVYRRNGTAWTHEEVLRPSEAGAAQFGWDVAVDGDTLLVGARSAAAGAVGGGEIYVYQWNGATWRQRQRLHPSDSSGNAYFGGSVDLTDTLAIVGATGRACDGIHTGAAIVYRRMPTGLAEQTILADADGSAADGFGSAVALGDGFAAVGAWLADTGAVNAGGLHVFDTTNPTALPRRCGAATLPEQVFGCTNDVDCVAGNFCEAGSCMSECSAAAPCGSGEVCELTSGRCAAVTSGPGLPPPPPVPAPGRTGRLELPSAVEVAGPGVSQPFSVTARDAAVGPIRLRTAGPIALRCRPGDPERDTCEISTLAKDMSRSVLVRVTDTSATGYAGQVLVYTETETHGVDVVINPPAHNPAVPVAGRYAGTARLIRAGMSDGAGAVGADSVSVPLTAFVRGAGGPGIYSLELDEPTGMLESMSHMPIKLYCGPHGCMVELRRYSFDATTAVITMGTSEGRLGENELSLRLDLRVENVFAAQAAAFPVVSWSISLHREGDASGPAPTYTAPAEPSPNARAVAIAPTAWEEAVTTALRTTTDGNADPIVIENGVERMQASHIKFGCRWPGGNGDVVKCANPAEPCWDMEVSAGCEVERVCGAPFAGAACGYVCRYRQPYMCSAQLACYRPNQAFPSGLSTSDDDITAGGDLLCRDGRFSAAVPLAAYVAGESVPRPGGGLVSSAAQMLRECVTDLSRAAPTSSAVTLDQALSGRACIDLGRVHYAMNWGSWRARNLGLNGGTLFGSDDWDEHEESAVFWRLLGQVAQVQAFVARQGRNEVVADTVARNVAATRPRPEHVSETELLDAMDASWALLLHPRWQTALAGFPVALMERPDYRTHMSGGFLYQEQSGVIQADEPAAAMPALTIEAMAATLELLAGVAEQEAFRPATSPVGSARRNEVLARLRHGLRQSVVAQTIAHGLHDRMVAAQPDDERVPHWLTRMHMAQRTLDAARQQLVRWTAVLAGGEPYGIFPGEIPLYYRSVPVGAPADDLYFAASDDLVALAQRATADLLGQSLHLRSDVAQLELQELSQADRLGRMTGDFAAGIGTLCGTDVAAGDWIAVDEGRLQNVARQECFLEPRCQFDVPTELAAHGVQPGYVQCLSSQLAVQLGYVEDRPSWVDLERTYFDSKSVSGETEWFLDYSEARLARYESETAYVEKVCGELFPGSAPVPELWQERRSDPTCFRGTLGEAAFAILGAEQDAKIARGRLDDQFERYHAAVRACIELETESESRDALRDMYKYQMDDVAYERKNATAFEAMGSAFMTVASMGMGGNPYSPIVSWMNTDASVAAGEADVLDARVNGQIRDIALLRDCKRQAEEARRGINTTWRLAEKAALDVGAAGLRFERLARELSNQLSLATDAAARYERQGGLSDLYEQWLSLDSDRYLASLRWTRKATYLAALAVEFDLLTSFGYTERILAAETAEELVDLAGELEAELVPGRVDGDRPVEVTFRFSVASHLQDQLGVDDEARADPANRAWLGRLLLSPKYADYDDDGMYRGQRVPLSMAPEYLDSQLDLACAEKVWQVSAQISGPSVTVGDNPGDPVPVFLQKQNSFFMRDCHGGFTWGGLRPLMNHLRGPNPSLLGDGAANAGVFQTFSSANLQAAVNPSSDLTHHGAPSNQLGGMPLWGEYAVFIPRGSLERLNLAALEDLELVFTVLTVDSL